MIRSEKEFLETMERCRGIMFARIGMMVEVDGKIGTIIGTINGNLKVEFANRLKFGKGGHNCHPFWRTKYYDAEGNVIADYTEDKNDLR